MTSNDTNNSTIDESVIGQPYKGAVKMVWKDGQRIQVPDYTLDNTVASNAANSPPFSPYVYQKTINDIISNENRREDYTHIFIWLEDSSSNNITLKLYFTRGYY
jgi:hypothetical protein